VEIRAMSTQVSAPVPPEVETLLIGGPRSEHLAHVRAWQRGHEQAMARHFVRAVRPGMTVVDAGAYLGYFTLLAANRVGRRGRVHAFEPHPESFRALRENVRANRFEDRVTAVPAALDDRSEIRRLRLEANPTQSTLAGGGNGNRSIEVECVALDQYLDTADAPGLVKVDVEGGEVAALAGMRNTLERVGDEFVMVIEFNPGALRRAGTGPGELLARVRAAGLEVRVIDERKGRIELPTPANLFERSWVNLWLSRSAASP
jgi:FkbM family methyltransferase